MAFIDFKSIILFTIVVNGCICTTNNQDGLQLNFVFIVSNLSFIGILIYLITLMNY